MIVRDTTGWPAGVIEKNKHGFYEVTYFGEVSDEPELIGSFRTAQTAVLVLKLRDQLWRLGEVEFSHVLRVQLKLAEELESELQETEAHHA